MPCLMSDSLLSLDLLHALGHTSWLYLQLCDNVMLRGAVRLVLCLLSTVWTLPARRRTIRLRREKGKQLIVTLLAAQDALD